ncbi:MAG: hypothetical protein IKE22_11390 [Atopobiaceae bacterium]|nr:hypothetical protein [Atopobiaceae bacterium]
MASIAGEIYKIARKKGFTGPDTYDIDKAVGAVTEGITGTPSPTYGTITDALSDLYTVVSGGGGGGGNPYEYCGIEFVTVQITGNTPPEEGDPVTSILLSSTVGDGEIPPFFQSIPQQLSQLVVPIMSGSATVLDLAANGGFTYIADTATTTGTGGVTVSDGQILVTGEGTINITWAWA